MSSLSPDFFGYRDVERSITRRARVTNRPLSRVRQDTPEGRRRADVFLAYLKTLGNPTDPGMQADILRAAELTVAAEIARSKLLSDPASCADVDNLNTLVRVENLVERALRRLGLDRKRAADESVPSLEQYLAATATASPQATDVPESQLDEVDL